VQRGEKSMNPEKTGKEAIMKRLRLIKTVSYFVFWTVVAAVAAIVPSEQAEATVSSYRLVDTAHGPRKDCKEQFNKYFVITGSEIGKNGGYIDISSKDAQGQVVASHRFQWMFSRDVSYLYPDPNNNLTVHMAVGGTATGGTSHFMKEAHSSGLALNFWDTTEMQFAETWSTPNERVYENMGWKTHEFHVWEYAYFKYTAIGFAINLWSHGQAAIYKVCYLYEDTASAQNGNVMEAQVASLWPVNSANCGETATLWALTNNTGNTALPSDASVWFYVRGPGVDGWVGSASVAGMNAGHEAWGYFYWTIPYHATGAYTYWAIVHSPTLGFISPWSYGQNFTVNCQ
jgi:hypothetical protein